MTKRTYTEQFFINQVEKSQIKSALTAAIPENVTYFNLIMALSEMLQDFSTLAFQDEVMHYPKDKTHD